MLALLRGLGLAAIAGGALRVVDSFTTQSLSAGTLAALYFATDVLLLLGIAGIYWSRRATLGVAGVIGAAIFVFGILLVRLSAFGLLGTNGYQLAAALALVGLVILSIEALLRRTDAGVSAPLWLVAFVFGIVGAFGVMTPVMTVLAGAAFGAGFVAAGFKVLSA
jgi:4-amino-4-deoxy-L-arabinose transferase-like glycosyltransferase